MPLEGVTTLPAGGGHLLPGSFIGAMVVETIVGDGITTELDPSQEPRGSAKWLST
jgi:hypothetical protein